ncbi:hypothetical protein GCM10009639_55030 [Kitasatospora putterlickiae]|uniref:Uncharacterized protein n=1 Tax=Kitasatospora putterlickiae TaxID=221725 RepID=A0ABN1YE14_9ACTN
MSLTVPSGATAVPVFIADFGTGFAGAVRVDIRSGFGPGGWRLAVGGWRLAGSVAVACGRVTPGRSWYSK